MSVSVEGFTAENIEISAVGENTNSAVSISLTAAPSTPVGAINGLFSVSATQQVYFSKGNLQYIGSAATPYWQFAENQWDYLGTTTGQNSVNDIVDRDLFGWGTSGYNHGATAYQPWATSISNNQYYAYGNYSNNLYDQTGQTDWGYNAIVNGGNTENSGWRTLTRDEWKYMFVSRTTTSGILYAKATVNNVNGVILLPDDWDASIYALDNTNTTNANFTSNTISAADWTNLEVNGAVFLPAAGHRNYKTVSNAGTYGYYWSSSYNNSSTAWSVELSNSKFHEDTNYRSAGYSVRLVRNAQ